MQDMITLLSSGLPSGARVLGFRCDEAISQPYQVEVFVSVGNDEELLLDDAIGARATLTLDREDDKIPPFIFTGVIATAEILRAFGGKTLVRILVVPRLWLLSLSRHSRIFTNQKVPDIVSRILEENGFGPDDYEMRLGSYEVEAHICQYRESDLEFISRWMEREGIYYFFEHTDGGERLILCDSRAYAHDAFGLPVRYVPQSGADVSAGMSFRSFAYQKTTLPATVRLRDYDYARPNLSLSSSARVSADGAGEVSVYGARFFTPRAGERLAQIRAEELCARQRIARASGSRMHLRTGHLFELDEHPRPELNAKYVTIEAHHEGNQATAEPDVRALVGFSHDDVYHVDIVAIPVAVQFRPESKTPWPRIYGYENGLVEGDATSEYAQIDDQGRYKVKLMFDESESKGNASSTFMRMAQPHAGAVEGFHFPLRKGVEVMVSFLGGDPDRPVLSSVVPNALTPSPVTTTNHTTNVIQTGGRNRIELEDHAGLQRITLSTPHANSQIRMGAAEHGEDEIAAYTEKNILVEAGQHHVTKVGTFGSGNMTTSVKNNKTIGIEAGNLETTITKGHMKTTLTEGNAEYTVVAGTQTTYVEGVVAEHYNAAQTTNVTTTRELTATDVTVTASSLIKEKTLAFRRETITPGSPVFDFYEDINAEGWHANVIKGTLNFICKDTIHFGATNSATLYSHYDTKVQAPMGKVLIQGAAVEIDATGETKNFTQGNEFNWRLSGAETIGLGFDLSVIGGVNISAFLGFKFDLSLGINCVVKMMPEIVLASTRVELAAFEFKTGSFKAALAAMFTFL